jgi:two-component system CheB/CheR fusion protein
MPAAPCATDGCSFLVGRIYNETGIFRRADALLTRFVTLHGILDVTFQVPVFPTPASKLGRRAAEQFEPNFLSRAQTLHVTLPRKPVYVTADPVRLDQVIGNLLDNASKYTDEGGNIWLTVGERPGAEDSSGTADAVIMVRDDGIGIEPGKLPHVFDLFMRVTQSRNQKYGGLGVGLTLVRRLVELHGGSVHARSDGEGRGCEFTVRLPAAQAPREAPPVAKGESLPAVARRVLIVDDNIDNAESLAMLLRRDSHEVEIANNGAAALEIAARFKPEAAVVDIGMPDMDGYEVARRLQRLNGSEKARLIALSGYADDSARGRAHAAGFDEYLVKPVDIARILELIGGA